MVSRSIFGMLYKQLFIHLFTITELYILRRYTQDNCEINEVYGLLKENHISINLCYTMTQKGQSICKP